MIENNELEQPNIKANKKGSKHESIIDNSITEISSVSNADATEPSIIDNSITEISSVSNADATEPTVEESVSTITQQETKSDMKQKLSGLVHPSRIKTKKPQKVNLKLIRKIKTNPVNFF